jgi:hypothetical protein
VKSVGERQSPPAGEKEPNLQDVKEKEPNLQDVKDTEDLLGFISNH